jgi:fatty acid desaturase
VFIALQHVGLAENVWDHRLNTRSIRFNFFCSFLFMNMGYHVEHHIYPLVPFHALPRLHERIKTQLPRPYRGLWEGSLELLPVLFRQQRDPAFFVRRPLP